MGKKLWKTQKIAAIDNRKTPITEKADKPGGA